MNSDKTAILGRTPLARALLAKDGFVTGARYVEARNTSSILFEEGVIINENDTVAVEEITFGDSRAAMLSHLVEADALDAHGRGQIRSC